VSFSKDAFTAKLHPVRPEVLSGNGWLSAEGTVRVPNIDSNDSAHRNRASR